MPIDPSILSGLRAPQITSPQELFAYKQQMEQNALAQRMGALKMKEFEQGQADNALLKNTYSQFGNDTAANQNMLFKAGLGKEALSYGKSNADLSKSRVDTATASHKLFTSSLGMIAANPTPQTVNAVLDDLERQTGKPAGPAKQIFAQAQTPEQIAEIAKRMGIELEKQLPKYETRNLGGTTDTLAIDPITGKTTTANSVANTQSPDNKASVSASMANAAATRKIAEAQLGMNQELKNIQLQKARGEQEDRKQSKQGSIDSVDAQISVIDKALSHPGRATSTGLSGSIDPRNFVPGTDAADFRAVLDQIGGAAFLQAFQTLKGGGQITEVEGKKATDAIARLSRSQSDEEFVKSLNDLKDVMQKGRARLSGQSAPSAASNIDDLLKKYEK